MKTTSEGAVSAAVFKAKCLALLARVARTGRPPVVTKRGRPVARVVPLEDVGPPSLGGSITHEDDIVSPIGAAWEADG